MTLGQSLTSKCLYDQRYMKDELPFEVHLYSSIWWRGLMAKAADCLSEDCEFESRRHRYCNA